MPSTVPSLSYGPHSPAWSPGMVKIVHSMPARIISLDVLRSRGILEFPPLFRMIAYRMMARLLRLKRKLIPGVLHSAPREARHLIGCLRSGYGQRPRRERDYSMIRKVDNAVADRLC